MDLNKRELKAEGASFAFGASVTVEDAHGREKAVDTRQTDNKATFVQNLHYWNKETAFHSTNNFDNSYFETIVKMGKDAVPFIIEELEKKPSQLVYALDCIFPGVVKYHGYVSLKDACDKWLSILK